MAAAEAALDLHIWEALAEPLLVKESCAAPDFYKNHSPGKC